jgi:hypothetical protein
MRFVMTTPTKRFVASVLAVAGLAGIARAAEPGKAVGTFTFDATVVTLAHATEAKVEGLFDSTKQDLLVVLTDKPLGSTAPADDVGLSLRARKGDIAALMLRIDGGKLVNVSVFHRGLAGKVILPGAWFDYKAAKPGTGTLKAAAKEFDGHKYAANVEFAALAAPAPKPTAAAAAAPAPKTAPEKLAPATTSNIDTKSANALLVQALMNRDERQSLEIIKLGVDPNGKDQYGVPMLSWAVMMCQPQVVKALVDKKADVNYQRAPGLTVLAEAAACPEAAKILRAAGAK